MKFRSLWLSILQLSRTINPPIWHWAAPGCPAARAPRGSINWSALSCCNTSSQHRGLSCLGRTEGMLHKQGRQLFSSKSPISKGASVIYRPNSGPRVSPQSFHNAVFPERFHRLLIFNKYYLPRLPMLHMFVSSAWQACVWGQVRPSPRSFSKFQLYLLILDLLFQQLIPFFFSSLILSWI